LKELGSFEAVSKKSFSQILLEKLEAYDPYFAE
jgi:hypothetical protein